MASSWDEIKNFQPDDFKRIGTAPLPIRIIAIVALVTAIWLLGYYKFISPQFDLIEAEKRKETELKQMFDKEQRKAANLEAYTQQLDEMKRSFGAMLRQLPDKTEVESLLVDLSQTSAANSLKVDYFKPSGEIAKEFYAEYPITLRVFGKYHELAKFISDVAALSRIVTLHDISISPQDASKPTELVMQMTAKTYRYLDESS